MRSIRFILLLSFLPLVAGANTYERLISRVSSCDGSPSERLYCAANVFAGTPYKAGTLDQNVSESLVVNFEQFDCVTFIENSFALSIALASTDKSFDTFKDALTTIRYRRSKIDGYASRLHYFSEWISDNANKGLVRDITKEAGGYACRKPVYFMSAHAGANTHLRDKRVLAKILESEKKISSQSFYRIGLQDVKKAYPGIQQGDIIAFTTSVEGLDIMHTAIARRTRNGIGIMHASSSKMRVTTENDLYEYMKSRPKIDGIRIIRVLQ